MKKFLRILGILVGIAMLVTLAIMLFLKIKNDTLEVRNKEINRQNSLAEAEYICTNATEKLKGIMEKIETDLKVNIEVADTGSLEENDIYFVTKVEDKYMYIVKEVVEEKDVFKIATDNANEPKYIVSFKTIGLDERLYTKVENYSVDKDGNITYIENK